MSGEGALPNRPAVTGKRVGDVWHVWIRVNGQEVLLDTAQAAKLAEDIAKVCAILDATPAPGSHEAAIDRIFARDRSGGKGDQGPASC